MAKGGILSRLSADDELLLNAASSSVEFLAKYQDVIMIYCGYILMDSHSDAVGKLTRNACYNSKRGYYELDFELQHNLRASGL
ncbi:hypothetical protein ACFL4I_01570 [Pseudomonadota bacterium]